MKRATKSMRGILALTLALWLLCGTALADNAINQGSANRAAHTVISTTIGEAYTVLIPAEVNVEFNAAATPFDIEVTALNLLPTHRLMVKLAQNGGSLIDAANEENKIDYVLCEADKTTRLTSYYFTAAGKRTSYIMIGQEAWKRAVAGSYSDAITFNVALTEK